MLYVLAEAGEGDVGRTTALYEVRERLGHYGKALLALTFALLDDPTSDAAYHRAAGRPQRRGRRLGHRRALGGGRRRLVDHEQRPAQHGPGAGRHGPHRPGATRWRPTWCAG